MQSDQSALFRLHILKAYLYSKASMFKGGGGSTLYEIYIGFCPRIDFHNSMHIDCLTYDYSICDIVFLLPIYMVKKRDVM